MSEGRKIIKPQAGFQEKFVKSNVDFAVGGGILGGGKEMSLDTPILTPTGWVRNGDLSVGDYICTPFGKPAEVTQLFDHKDKDIYLLTTSDGRQVECGIEHLWAIRTQKQLEKYRNDGDVAGHLTVCDTGELIDRLKAGKKSYIPIPDAQEFEEKQYVIPPYVLGVLIGDGCLTDSSWAFDTAFLVSNTEEDVIQKVYLLSRSTRIYVQPNCHTKKFYSESAKAYKAYCIEKGLNTYSFNKYIPEEYLWGSVEQRKQLLAGLFDTDGHVEVNGSYRYTTTSERLFHDVLYLCRSLGYIATSSYDKRADKYTSGKCFTIQIQTDEKIFTSKKHSDKWAVAYSKPKKFIRKRKHVYVESIEWLRKDDARCLLLNDPLHLYIAGDFITTHNSFAAVLSVAEPSLDPNFRALFLRNNLGDLRSGGGLLDNFREAYGSSVEITESGEPRVTFPSGARVDVTHVSDQSREKVLQRFKGRQYDMIYFDEGTGFTWECFTAIYTRNRGKAKWTGKVRMTTNPDRDHWLRTFLDWYIGLDGSILEERAGVVRYFYIAGETPKDVVWGDTVDDVYRQCRVDINRKLAKVNGETGTLTYKDMIKSFTFYLGKMSENKAMLEGNDGYAGSVAVMGGRNAQQLLEGNWNVSANDVTDSPITTEMANSVFLNDPQRNGDRWVTCDLADTGEDNFVAIAWDGFHVLDVLVLSKTTPRMNAERLQMFAASYDVADSHIIYDAVRGIYINDYIEEAIPFISYHAPMGVYGRGALKLKDECYMRLVEVIRRNELSFEDGVAERIYEHQNIKDKITIQNEFVEECQVVRFREAPSGKKTLYGKKEMNAKLGKRRSMDLLDPIAMRMVPCLEFPYGEELLGTMVDLKKEREEDDDVLVGVGSIYDEATWC